MALVVLLRGVNVGGHKTFSPKKLAEELKRLNVLNIGAAGTFIVRKKTSLTALKKAFMTKLPFDTKIVVCQGRDILDLITNDPFAKEKQTPDVVRFVSVLEKTARQEPSYPHVLPPSGPWLVQLIGRRGRYVFGMYRRHMNVIKYLGKTDKEFDVPVTTRNWNTIETIGRALAEDTRSGKHNRGN